MKSFKDYVEKRFNIKMPEGNISGEWFMKSSLPMIVKCSCCEMTMASPSAWVDYEEYTYCSDCADIREENENEN